MSSKITALTALAAASVQNDDVLPVVDVHDTTMAPSGTTKKVAVSDLIPVAGFSGGKWIIQGEPQPAQILTEFQSGHGYTNNAGSTFTANDTSDFVLGAQAASIVTGGTGAAANVSNAGQPSFTTAGRTIRLRLKIDDITHMAALNFFLGSSAFANNYKWAIQTTPIGSNYVITGQWLVVTLNWHDAVVTGSPSRSALTDVRLQVTDDATAAVKLHCQSVELVPDASAIFPAGVISITFDDSYQDAWSNGKPRLDLYGYPASVYTIQDLVGGSGRLTLAELKQLQDLQGWELGGHAYLDADHSSRFTGLTAAVLDSDLRNMKAWGDANGFRGSMGLAYPGGQYGVTTDSQPTTDIVRRYNAYARTVNSKTKETLPPGDPFRLRAISDITSFAGGYAPANLTGAGGDFDKCAANQTWLILSFHEVVTVTPTATTQILQSDFNAVIDSISSHGIPVLPIGDVLRKLQAGASASVTLDTADTPRPDAAPASIGSGTQPGPWDHAHPRTVWTGPDYGLLTMTFDPVIASNSTVPTAGLLYLVRVHLPVAATITNVLAYVAVLGTGLTSGQCFAALYDHSGNLLSATADQAAAWASTGLKTMALTSPQACAAGDYYVALFQNGSANVAFARAISSSSIVNAGFSSANSRFATGAAGNTTVMPGAAGTLSGTGNAALWAGLS